MNENVTEKEDGLREVMEQSIDSSTLRQYEHRWEAWKTHCQEKDVPVYGSSTRQFLRFLASVSETNSTSIIYSYVSAINHFHRLKFLESPSRNEHVTMFMKGMKRYVCVQII